jgi:hypothetical protein
MIFALTCALAALALASGAIEADKITKLPGFVGDLPSTHYSGCKNNTKLTNSECILFNL